MSEKFVRYVDISSTLSGRIGHSVVDFTMLAVSSASKRLCAVLNTQEEAHESSLTECLQGIISRPIDHLKLLVAPRQGPCA